MDVNVTNPATETMAPSSTAECSNVQEGENVKDLGASGNTVTPQNISQSSESSQQSCANDANPVVLQTSDRSSSETSTEAKVTTFKANEEKEIESSEGGKKSPGAVSDTIKAFEDKIKSEEIEMSTFQNPSHGSQPSDGDRKEAAMSGDISKFGKDKISSSTPCLLSSEKVADTSEKPTVIQKATSSPVLPVIKITQVDENEGECVIHESLEPAESNVEIRQEPVRKPTSDISVDTSAQSSSKDEGHSEEHTAKDLSPLISSAERGEEESSKTSDPTHSFIEGNEEQTANASVQTIVPAENITPRGTPENDERKAYFYISSSQVTPDKRSSSDESEGSSSFSQVTLEEPSCLGPKCLHVGILMCCVFFVFVALSCYKLAHEGKIDKIYEIAALCVASIAVVLGVFSALYISFQMCFPVIPDFQYESIGSVNSIDYTLMKNSRLEVEQDPSTSLDSDQKLKTEVEGLLQTFSDIISKQSVEVSTEESSNGRDEVQKDYDGEPTANQVGDSSSDEKTLESSSGSDSSKTLTPSKKDD